MKNNCDIKILNLIKIRYSVREYKDNPITKSTIEKIVQAGVWGPAIHHFQPWEFVVILDKQKIIDLCKTFAKMVKTNRKLFPRFMIKPTLEAMHNTQCLIAVYNTKDFTRFYKYFTQSKRVPRIAEISAIAAAIQNMFIIAESLGIGGCWLTAPIFCQREINKFLKVRKKELIALLTFGYPVESIKKNRSRRKEYDHTVKYI